MRGLSARRILLATLPIGPHRREPTASLQDSRTSGTWPSKARPSGLATLRHRQKPFPLCLFTGDFAGASNRLRFFPCFSLRWLLVCLTLLHLAEETFALHLLLQNTNSLLDVVVADKDLQSNFQSELRRIPDLGYNRSSGRRLIVLMPRYTLIMPGQQR